MAEAGDEVADHQRPMSHAIEPIVHARDLAIVDVEESAKLGMEKLPADSASDDVAASDSAHAAGERADRGWNQEKMPLKNKKTAACEQELIRDGQAHNAEHQERENRDVAVGGDPMKDCGFQLEG